MVNEYNSSYCQQQAVFLDALFDLEFVEKHVVLSESLLLIK